MVRFLVATAFRLGASAVALLIASLVLDDFDITVPGFIMAVAIFTGLTIVFEPLITKIALSSAPALRGSVALVTTFVGLVLTDWLSDSLSINGIWTWVLATIIVWLGALVAALLLPIVFVKKQAEERRSDPPAPSNEAG